MRNPNRARDERKYELIYLQRHVDELEARLRELQGRANLESSHSDEPVHLGGILDSSTSIYSAGCQNAQTWKETARRLCAAREKAEKENIRLRLLVDRQLKTAKRVEKVVLGTRGMRVKSSSPDLVRLSQEAGVSVGIAGDRDPRGQRRSLLMDMLPNPVLFGSTEQTFDMLLQAAEVVRDEVDTVFRANGLSAIDSAYRSARVTQDATNGKVMEFMSDKLLKSDIRTAHQVAWRHFAHSQPQMPHRTLSEYHDERKVVFVGHFAFPWCC